MSSSTVNRREFARLLGAGAVALAAPTISRAAQSTLNVMLFTADDLNRDSLGCFGSPVPDITPNLDRFAAEGMRLERAHVTAAICQPSRGALGTGRYPYHSGVMGFMHTDRPIPTVMQVFRDAGYLTGILGKVGHSTPKADYQWDYMRDQKDLGAGRSPKIYHDSCVEFLARCRKEGKPFYFMVNSHDPHRPYHVPGPNYYGKAGGAEVPSRIYKPSEINIPGFLPDLPQVREEMATYFNSVRRLDDTFGAVMAALKETGFEGNTLVMFLSDNGIAMPFAKCNSYLASTNTPWIVRWPGVVKPGAVDREHFISGIDFMPTAIEAAGLKSLDGLDGVSFVPLLKGQAQSGRDHVFTQIDCKAGGDAVPMRCVQNRRFGYIFNSWADGEHRYRNNNEGQAMKAMEAAAATDPALAARVQVYRFRAPEEFYDLEKDPNCLNNLIANPEYKADVEQLRAMLVAHMTAGGDPLYASFEKRDAPKQMSDEMWKAYAPYSPAAKRGDRSGDKPARDKKTDKTGAKKDRKSNKTPAAETAAGEEDD